MEKRIYFFLLAGAEKIKKGHRGQKGYFFLEAAWFTGKRISPKSFKIHVPLHGKKAIMEKEKEMIKIQHFSDENTLRELFRKQKVLIFKNSMHCGISKNAREQIEKFAMEADNSIEIYMVDVLKERELSKKIEEITGISHESPQAIYMETGKILWNASHFKITAEELKKAVNARPG